MFSTKIIKKQNLIDNVLYLKNRCEADLCVMVKADAYGHGDRQVVEILSEYVECFGVSNQMEAFGIRQHTDKPIIVFGACDDYFECMAKNIDFALFSLEQAKKIVDVYKGSNIKPKPHLCINTGMNRYGVKTIAECKKIIKLFLKNGLSLKGIYTHYSSLTTDENYTKSQEKRFKEFCKLIPGEWDCLTHVGGGRSIFEGLRADMFRVGLYVYGYGDENLKPVMSITSKIVDIQAVGKGEHIGYLCGYTAERDMKVATIPLGYGDGFPRLLSNRLEVSVNGRKAQNVGNICMDAFMVDVTDVLCKVGDDVVVFEDAGGFASMLNTTEYEVLTNMSRLRGAKKVE